MEAYSNKIANLFSNKFRLKKGDCVAIVMENCPEYVGIWLGLSKIGVITSCINTNLKYQPLLHCLTASNASLVVYGASLEESISTVIKELDQEVRLVVNNEDEIKTKSSTALVLNSTLEYVSDQIEYSNEEPLTLNDTIMYIFTSGTTGLPKPAIIRQNRYFGAAYGTSIAGTITASDRVFVTLPIYHGNGFFIGIGSAIITGATVILRKKFSASNFLKEVISTEATKFVYVGEICRFLVNQPVSPLERMHKVRAAIGNGLRKDIWVEFNRRFGIKCVEFYGATEGNCTMLNLTSNLGSCGFVPLIQYLKRISPVCLVRIDEDMNLIRDGNGFCIECRRGEKGLLIGLISSIPTSAYNGYANNKKASSTKIVENVFEKRQQAFNSGDLMVCDSYGYFTFCDRLGDTFRWRGENVATIEVENIINSGFRGIEVVVYGVEIPGEEGKCGMAAIKINEDSDFNLAQLSRHLKKNLAVFARPVFVRITDYIEYTGTFKVKKNKLVEEGYNAGLVKDKVYYLESKTQIYQEMTLDIYEKIRGANFRM